MGFRIAKSIPLPKKIKGTRQGKYPWADLEKGHSILVQDEEGDEFGAARQRAKQSARQFEKRHSGIKFIWEDYPDGSARIWREK